MTGFLPKVISLSIVGQIFDLMHAHLAIPISVVFTISIRKWGFRTIPVDKRLGLLVTKRCGSTKLAIASSYTTSKVKFVRPA